MALSRFSKRPFPWAGQSPLRWAAAPVILSVFVVVQLTAILHAADTPSPTKASSPQPPGTPGEPAVSPNLDQTAETAQLERRMWELINENRADPSHRMETHGQAWPLKWDEKLAEIARSHSRDMVERAYVGHFSPDGSFFAQRISQGGIEYLSAAENIAKFRDVLRAQAAFMNEPPLSHNHRANILNPDFTHVGVGILRASDGMFYITQEFVQKP